MAKEFVKYKNDMNKLSFKGFTKNDMNLFMAICSMVKEKGTNEIILDFEYLRSISGYTATMVDSFIKDLRKMSKDVMSVNCEVITEDKIDLFNLFTRFTIEKNNKKLFVKINPEFTWLLNEFTDRVKGYTIFELQEFVGLQSKYAKNLYRILKQWRTTGKFVFNNMDEFRLKLDVPDSYANKRLTEKIVKPAVTEIQELDKSFENFKCEPLYLCKRGKPLAGYKFTWKPESSRSEGQKQKETNAFRKTRESKNKFFNFTQREYDYDAIEKTLLNIEDKHPEENLGKFSELLENLENN